MKNQLKLLALALIASGSMTMYGMQNINIPKVVAEVRKVAEQVPNATIAEFNSALEQTLTNIPNELLGINIMALPDGKIDSQTAQKIGSFLPEVRGIVDRVQALVQMPETAVELFQTVYAIIAAQLPQSVQNTVAAGLTVANTLVNSTDPVDQAAVAAIQNIVTEVQQIAIGLAEAQKNGSLVGYQLSNEVNMFKAAVLRNLPTVQAAVARHMAAIQNVVKAVLTVSLEDLKNTQNAALELAKGLGL